MAEPAERHPEILAALQEWWTQPLTPEEAAAECPWKAGAMRRKIGDSSLTRASRTGRCDLYGAFTAALDSQEIEGPDPAEEVLAGLECS